MKEKFGVLVVFIDYGEVSHECRERMEAAIDLAEISSAAVCELCGRPGRLFGRSWTKTLCSEHGDKYENGDARKE